MTYLPLPSDLGALALQTLRQELIPALPADLRYQALMTAKALEYALTHSDETRAEGQEAAQDLAQALGQEGAALSPAHIAQLRQHVARELAKTSTRARAAQNSEG